VVPRGTIAVAASDDSGAVERGQTAYIALGVGADLAGGRTEEAEHNEGGKGRDRGGGHLQAVASTVLGSLAVVNVLEAAVLAVVVALAGSVHYCRAETVQVRCFESSEGVRRCAFADGHVVQHCLRKTTEGLAAENMYARRAEVQRGWTQMACVAPPDCSAYT